MPTGEPPVETSRRAPPGFQRGPGPLVSILLPTRGRTKWLLEAVDSIHSLASDPTLVEYVFKVDFDDAESIETTRKLAEKLPCRILISPRGRGYFDLHEYVNDLSAISKGDWLFIFNDDARMKTKAWDQVLLHADCSQVPRWGGNDDVCLLGPRVLEREISWEFPVLRRKTYQILGHFSMAYSNDAYIYWVMSGLQAAVVLPGIEISHFVNEIDDTIKREGSSAAAKQSMSSLTQPEMMRLQMKDSALLKRYLAQARKETSP
jgi:hypothetical protein